MSDELLMESLSPNCDSAGGGSLPVDESELLPSEEGRLLVSVSDIGLSGSKVLTAGGSDAVESVAMSLLLSMGRVGCPCSRKKR